MQVVYTFDDEKEGDMQEMRRREQAMAMWGFINSFKTQVYEWYKYPTDNEPLTPDTLMAFMNSWFLEYGLRRDDF